MTSKVVKRLLITITVTRSEELALMARAVKVAGVRPATFARRATLERAKQVLVAAEATRQLKREPHPRIATVDAECVTLAAAPLLPEEPSEAGVEAFVEECMRRGVGTRTDVSACLRAYLAAERERAAMLQQLRAKEEIVVGGKRGKA